MSRVPTSVMNMAVHDAREYVRLHQQIVDAQLVLLLHGLANIIEKTAGEQKQRGMAKLTEECGEVLQLLGKLQAFPTGDHPDGKGPVIGRLEGELGDLAAAIEYFVECNKLAPGIIATRRDAKLALFRQWGGEGTTP